jgi:hypothetical protein
LSGERSSNLSQSLRKRSAPAGGIARSEAAMIFPDVLKTQKAGLAKILIRYAVADFLADLGRWQMQFDTRRREIIALIAAVQVACHR